MEQQKPQFRYYYGDESDFELVITLLEDALEGLIEEIITR